VSELVQLRVGRRESERLAVPPADPSAPAVYVETFGCQMNEADTSLIHARLATGGYRRVPDPAQADVILLNTCAIREKAEERVWGRTSQLLRYRAARPHLLIGITGCMAERLRDEVQQRAPYIGLVAGPDTYRSIAQYVDRARAGERVVAVELDREEAYADLDGVADDDGVSTYVTIQRGCDKFCSFCVVPFTRGRERAVPPRDILRQVSARVAQGYREVTLLGQTVNSYRWEDVGFAALLRSIAQHTGIERIRFTSPYPLDFDGDLIDAMATTQQICPQVHLPLQSGSDSVLQAMRRGYGRDDYLAIVRRLRDRIPGLALSTDLLVGFCGETEADLQATLEVMEEVRFDTAFMFAYSDRGITRAARKLADDVPPEVKQERLERVIALQERHTRASYDAWVGREVEVLVTHLAQRGNAVVGRTPHFHKVFLAPEQARPGDLLRVPIASSTGHSLLAAP
jgi:tRNA-2-methylthio-N6-dimethylallyladenosine synthase